jgi:hypothetical protein
MSRHAKLERILQAWYDFEAGAPAEKAARREAFYQLLDDARAGSNVSRNELILSLADRYGAFRTAKEKEMRAKLSRLH